MHICPVCAGAVVAAIGALYGAVRGWHYGCKLCRPVEPPTERTVEADCCSAQSAPELDVEPDDSDNCCEHKED